MAVATTFHNEGYEDIRDRQRKRQANEVQSLSSTALNILCSLFKQKSEEIEELKQKVQEYNQKFGCQDKNIDSLKARIKELEEEVKILKEQLETSRKKLIDTQEKLLQVESKNDALEQKVEALQGDQNILYLGEMCKRLQRNIYRYVFPEKIKISPIVSYKIINIESNIEKMKKLSEQEKREAKIRWEILKTQLKPVEFYSLMEELQDLRNTSAHPEITDDIKDVVSKAAEELNKQGVFEFMASFDDVNKLIRIWEATEKL